MIFRCGGKRKTKQLSTLRGVTRGGGEGEKVKDEYIDNQPLYIAAFCSELLAICNSIKAADSTSNKAQIYYRRDSLFSQASASGPWLVCTGFAALVNRVIYTLFRVLSHI